ncbi:Malate dehydrogenase, cytoplasmic [Mortierella sp. GBA43]|nr:Malate dehydrogenase, cytoplasmic [Mortierella sp. GBA43]
MVKVTICGAAGGIGQPLSLLLKQSDLITDLAIYDVVNAPGVAADLSHINTRSTVKGYGKEEIDAALSGAHTVVIPAGVPRKPGMTRDDLFKVNAGIVQTLAEGIVKNCPEAFVLVISNPVNSTVPIVAEVFRKHGTFNPKRLFGITTLDSVRASRFLHEVVPKFSAEKTRITVIGGHSGVTIVPVLSTALGADQSLVGDESLKQLVYRIQYGGDEVVKAKDGETGLVESAYVNLLADEAVTAAFRDTEKLEYFAQDVEFGREGIKRIEPLPALSNEEKTLLTAAITQLKTDIEKGVSFVQSAQNA